MPTTYRTWVGRTLPTWLLEKWGGRVAASQALVFDMLGEMTLQAVKARYLDADTFPEDALRLIGSERMIKRVAAETSAGYWTRLKNAWRAWETAGTDQSIIEQLAAMGLTASVQKNFDWDWDSQPENWSRFWVVIVDSPWTRRKWGDGHKYGDGAAWGLSATEEEIRGIRQVIRQWKPGHVICVNVIVVFDDPQWAIDAAAMSGDWDEPANRSEAAVYCGGSKL